MIKHTCEVNVSKPRKYVVMLGTLTQTCDNLPSPVTEAK